MEPVLFSRLRKNFTIRKRSFLIAPVLSKLFRRNKLSPSGNAVFWCNPFFLPLRERFRSFLILPVSLAFFPESLPVRFTVLRLFLRTLWKSFWNFLFLWNFSGLHYCLFVKVHPDSPSPRNMPRKPLFLQDSRLPVFCAPGLPVEPQQWYTSTHFTACQQVF